MKISSVGKLVTVALMLLSAAVPSDRISPPNRGESTHQYRCTVLMSTGSFDEALWQALGNLARVEHSLPDAIRSFRLEILPSESISTSVILDFARPDLVRLRSSELSPEEFIRSYVRFL